VRKWTIIFTNMALFTLLWWTSFVEREAILLRKGALQRAWKLQKVCGLIQKCALICNYLRQKAP